MFVSESLPFVTDFVEELNRALCWKRFERDSLGRYRYAALYWVFRMLWKWLLRDSIQVILWKYGITGGILVIDDSDKPRSKST